MPIYTYQCPICKVIEEKLLNRKDRLDYMIQDCCFCNSQNVEFKRMITAPSGFRFKGEGFYKKTSNFD